MGQPNQDGIVKIDAETFKEWLSKTGICACGMSTSAFKSLRSILTFISNRSTLDEIKDSTVALDTLIPDQGTQYLLLYFLDILDLTEHGGSVSGCWLTPLGEQVLEFLDPLSDDEIDALT